MFASLKQKRFGGGAKNTAARSQQVPGLAPTQLVGEASDLLKGGNELLGRGRLKEAAQCYRQALALAPNDVAGHGQPGRAARHLARPAPAPPPPREAAAPAPPNRGPRLLIGASQTAAPEP